MFGRVPRHLLLAALAMTAGCSESRAGCFAAGTKLPDRAAIAASRTLGASARELATALLDGDAAAARRLLDADPGLARARIDAEADMLVAAIAGCSRDAVDLVLAKGASADGLRPGAPLIFALRANEPWYAERLLRAGASPNPKDDPLGPMRTAISLNSAGGVRLLLDHRADPNAHERTGATALLTALRMETFGIAELLLDRGADAWAIDSNGGNLASALAAPMLTKSAQEAAARTRLIARLKTLGWPDPAPTSREVRGLALAGQWPPADARGARPVPPQVLAIIRANTTHH